MKSSLTRLLLVLMAVGALIGAYACAVPAGPPPTLRIISPAEGTTVPAGAVTLTVQVTNFAVVQKLSQGNVPGEGHVHYYLDATPPTEPGKPAVTAAGTYAAAATTTYTWSNVTPGVHKLWVQLVNNDHTPLSAPIIVSVTITVLGSATLQITSPVDGVTVPAGPVTVTVQVSNFSVTDKRGQGNVPGEGHIHYYLDVTPPTEPGKPAVTAAGTYAASVATSNTWSNVTGGMHTFYAQLVNNDHTPLGPAVVAKVTVNVQAISPIVKIKSPVSGATVPSGAVTVTIEVTNFQILQAGGANAPGQGHIHYYLDAAPPTEPGKPAVTVAGTYAATPNTSYTWPNLAPGSHTLSVQLVNNDHTPLSVPVIDRVTINVAGPVPYMPPPGGGGGGYGY